MEADDYARYLAELALGRAARAVLPLSVSQLVIDFDTGSDNNPGTALLPIKTIAEMKRRVRGGVTGQVTVTMRAPLSGVWPLSDPWSQDFGYLGVGNRLDVIGDPIVVASTQLSGFTNRNFAADQPYVVTSAALGSWAPYRSKLLRIMSGPNAGASGWIGATAGPNSARIADLNFVNLNQPFPSPIAVPLVGNELVQIETHIEMRQAHLVGIGTNDFPIEPNAPFTLNIRGFRFTDALAQIGIVNGALWECCIEPDAFSSSLGFAFASIGGLVTGNAVCFSGALGGGFGVDPGAALAVQGSLIIDETGLLTQGTMRLFNGNMVQSCGPMFMYAATTDVDVHGDLGLFDSASFFTINRGATLQVTCLVGDPLWGAGNTGPIFDVILGTVNHRGVTGAMHSGMTSAAFDFRFAGSRTSGPATDPATFLPSAARNYTFANLYATFGAGGFGGNAIDPFTDSKVVQPSG